MTLKILVTGATGFIGGALSAHLQNTEGFQVVGTTRQNLQATKAGIRLVRTSNMADSRGWAEAMKGVDIIVHCAARVHQKSNGNFIKRNLYEQDNALNTLHLARIAAITGVKRFILLSSLKVNGENSKLGAPIRPEDAPRPTDPYAKSKLRAEEALWETAASSAMEAVVVRPPLVYGPGVRANFESLIRWLDRGIPLPLAALDNKRSLVYIHNLVSLLTVCVASKNASGEVFFVSDGQDLTVKELALRLRALLGRQASLMRVSPSVLRNLAAAIGKSQTAVKVLDSFEVDITKTKKVLKWEPPYSTDQGLKETVDYWRYKSSRSV